MNQIDRLLERYDAIPAFGPDIPRANLRTLVREVYKASLNREEGRDVLLNVAFAIEPRGQIRFAEPKPATYDQFIRLAPVCDAKSSLVISDDGRHIVGIWDRLADLRTRGRGRIFSEAWSNDFYFASLRALGPGWIRLGANTAGSVELRNMEIGEFISLRYVPEFTEWFKTIFGDNWVRLSADWCETLEHTIDAKHGGTFLWSREMAPVDTLRIKYAHNEIDCTERRQQLEELEKDGGIESTEIAYQSEEAISRFNLFLTSLASADGAVVLRGALNLVGFGAEIRAATPDKVVQKNAVTGLVQPFDVEKFGMRHRSAVAFCACTPDSLAFVVSQDGGLKIVKSGNPVTVFTNIEPTLSERSTGSESQ